MWSLFEKTLLIRTNQIIEAGYSSVNMCICLQVCIYVSLCLHHFSPAPPSSYWQVACLHFSHSHVLSSGRCITLQTQNYRSSSLCLLHATSHTTKKHESCSNKHVLVDSKGSFKDCKLLGFMIAHWIANTWDVSLADIHLASGLLARIADGELLTVHRFVVLELHFRGQNQMFGKQFNCCLQFSRIVQLDLLLERAVFPWLLLGMVISFHYYHCCCIVLYTDLLFASGKFHV